MLLLTGYRQLPQREVYWQNLSDVLNSAVFNAMSRNRFEELLLVLHLSNNKKLDTSNKLDMSLLYATSLNPNHILKIF